MSARIPRRESRLTFVPPVVLAPLEVLFADAALAVIVKPPELLSCPGTSTPDWDSVSRRVPALFPPAEGPILAHRLDAATSGLMVVALTSDAHRLLSQQFAQRTVHKAYEALLDGVVDGDAGLIDLPMRGEWRLRPRQVIDPVHGKTAQTRWSVLARDGARTRVRLEPITGRTHQLRLHAADARGLATPIVGDRIYGTAADRLYLHACALSFTHPIDSRRLRFESRAPF